MYESVMAMDKGNDQLGQEGIWLGCTTDASDPTKFAPQIPHGPHWGHRAADPSANKTANVAQPDSYWWLNTDAEIQATDSWAGV